MKDMLTLKEILAMLVRRGKLLICIALVFAFFFGGVQAARLVSNAQKEENSPEKIEERYQEAVVSYEQSKESLEYQLSREKRKAESQEEYNENSLKMQLDPYNVAVTTINIAISDIDDNAFQMVYQIERTPVDYIVFQILDRYMLYWNSFDLKQNLTQGVYKGVEDKYLRELITVNTTNSGGLTITVQGKTKQDSKRLADDVYRCLLDIQSTIVESSYSHQFVKINEATKILVDEWMMDFQRSNLDQLKANQDSIESLEKQLEELAKKEPEREKGYSVFEILKSTVKWAALGAFMGVFFACAWVALAYIFWGHTESLRRVEAVSSLAFLGSSQPPQNLLERFSQWILGEQGWPNQNEALSYLKESLRASLPKGANVTVLSTLSLESQQSEVQAVCDVLSSLGHVVQFVPGAIHAPEAIGAVQSCQCVVLLEKIGLTRWPNITKLQDLMQRMEKPINGFITL